MHTASPRRRDGRIIIHFDYDCFYAAVFEREDPTLKSLPLAVQQKQIIVTCNYEARRRGLYKLQLVQEARRKCPDVIILLGEDLTRFRNASKDNYNFLRGYIWSNKVERLGFDEVFVDVTDMIDYNFALLNHNDLNGSFFHLHRDDPTVGFPFDATKVFGHTFPPTSLSDTSKCVPADGPISNDRNDLLLRLCLGSHLAQYLRHQLEEHKGYTSTVGISTNKIISKLVGNLNKPKGQTTLLPPYSPDFRYGRSNVIEFIDRHDIGKVPGIGFKIAQKLRDHILGRPAVFSAGLVYGGTKEDVKVRDIRTLENLGPEMLGQLLAGPGVPRDLAEKIWGLLHGVDETEVAKAKEVPQQISIEDSYIRLDEIGEVRRELSMLSGSLIKRMRLDLTTLHDEDDVGILHEGKGHDESPDSTATASRRWIAHPKTLRLSTRPRPALNPDGTRPRTFARMSKSSSMPTFVFSFTHTVDFLAERLVEEALLPLFWKLHQEKSGWDLSLVNVCATNMSMTASESGMGAGRDIGKMFRRQEDVLKDWKISDLNIELPDNDNEPENDRTEQADSRSTEHQLTDHQSPKNPFLGSEDLHPLIREVSQGDDAWNSEDDLVDLGDKCIQCGAVMPPFAMIAHERFHSLPD